MKLIKTVSGTVCIRVSGDEAVPPLGVDLRQLIDFIATTYQFAVKPQMPQGLIIPINQPLLFQAGVMTKENDKWPITQLVSVQNGDMVTAASTEIADAVLEDYMSQLDKQLGFRFSQAEKRKVYLSGITVEFEKGIESQIRGLAEIEAILGRELKRTDPFKIKRLAFGWGDPVVPTDLNFQTIESFDFTIERRVDEPYSRNRYISIAPTTLSEHLRILQAIEDTLAG